MSDLFVNYFAKTEIVLLHLCAHVERRLNFLNVLLDGVRDESQELQSFDDDVCEDVKDDQFADFRVQKSLLVQSYQKFFDLVGVDGIELERLVRVESLLRALLLHHSDHSLVDVILTINFNVHEDQVELQDDQIFRAQDPV